MKNVKIVRKNIDRLSSSPMVLQLLKLVVFWKYSNFKCVVLKIPKQNQCFLCNSSIREVRNFIVGENYTC